MNIEMLNERLTKTGFKQLGDGDGSEEAIGMIIRFDRATKFIINNSAIYANGLPIISTYNDRSTAEAVFIDMMEAIYGDAFVLDKRYAPVDVRELCKDCGKIIELTCVKNEGPCPEKTHCNCMHEKAKVQ